jgi:hypothetical protein
MCLVTDEEVNAGAVPTALSLSQTPPPQSPSKFPQKRSTLVDVAPSDKARSRGSPGAGSSRISPPPSLVAEDDRTQLDRHTTLSTEPAQGMFGPTIVNPIFPNNI